jgi:flavin-dependent dehydrogenase
MEHSVVLRSRDGRTFEAPLVIAADGVNGPVGRRLRLNRGWSPTALAIDMMEETPNDQLRSLDPEQLWVAYGYGGSEGYAYVFPKETHVNVGIGYVLDYYRTRVAPHPWDLQQAFTSELASRHVLEGRSSRSHFTPYMIPVGGPLKVTASRRVMLAGDAGGFVNGITAEGIYYAMVSGSLAGQAALAGSTIAYERSWRREIGAELRDAVLVQRYLLTTPARVDSLIAAARRAPDLADLVVRYAMGEVSYRAVRRQLLMRSPLLGVRLFITALLQRDGDGHGSSSLREAHPASPAGAR